MKKAKVAIADASGGTVTVEHGATVGAMLGVNLWISDPSAAAGRRLLVAADLVPAAAPPPLLTPTSWRVLLDIPANVRAVETLATNGLVVRKVDGSWLTREILPTVGRTTIASGDGDAGDIVIDLAVVVDSGAGALLAITRDSYGRVTGTKPVTAGANVTITDIGASIEIAATGGGGAATDPFIGSVGSLLHFDGADGSTVFTDVRGKTWTANGNAQLDTAQFKFGTASLLCDGAGDYASASHVDLDLHNDDFTLEGWIRMAVAGIENGLFINGNPASNDNRVQLSVTSANVLGGFMSPSAGAGTSCLGATVLTTGVWYHVAFVRRGSRLAVFVDGVLDGTATFAGTQAAATTSYIGTARASSAQQYFNGWIDDFRITKGFCRYNVNFAPPTAAFPDT